MAKLNKQEVVSNEDIVKQIIEDFTQRQQERKKFEANWQLNINFFVGNQYCAINSNNDVVDFEKQFFCGLSHVVFTLAL